MANFAEVYDNMDIFSIFSLLGGLAFFLYGMKIMGNGLEKMAGGRLERILEGLTSNKYLGVFLGLTITAIIQSSSATTVMVVGFVNSGLMRLSQAIGVIMGANIGTTVTSWILCLTGIGGESTFFKLLSPDSFAPLLALVGIIFIMASKKSKHQEFGSILVGFAILMAGMTTMSDAVKPLSEMPGFASFLLLFKNPIFGILAGTVLTAIIQSSSASIGILQALSVTGSITFATAIPIILGQNIGTCITAMISSIGAKPDAKRAAYVHLYFNVIGKTILILIFYIINAFVQFKFMDSAATMVGIAVIHTGLNFITTICLLPFTKQLEKIAVLTVKDDNSSDNAFALLDERFLNSPSFAVERCTILVGRMAELAKKTISEAFTLVGNYNQATADKVAKHEDTIDEYEDRIGDYLVKIAACNLSGSDSETVTLLLQSIGDFERISDYAVNVCESSYEMYEKNKNFSPFAFEELSVLCNAVSEIVDMAVEAFIKRDVELAKCVEPLEEVVDELCHDMRSRHISRLQQGGCTIETGFVYTDLLTGIERVSDHCSNIAISIIQYDDDDGVTHEFAHEIKMRGKLYKSRYSEYRTKYALPKE